MNKGTDRKVGNPLDRFPLFFGILNQSGPKLRVGLLEPVRETRYRKNNILLLLL